MKRISKILIASSLVFLGTSCSKDKEDDKNNSNNNSVSLEAAIVGSWDQTSLEEKNGTITLNGMPYMTYTGKAINDQSTWVFHSNPKEVDVNASYDFVMNWSNGSMSSSDTTALSANTNMNYTLTGNDKITLSDAATGKSVEFDVVSFSNSKLELKNHTEHTDTTSGMTMTSSTDVFITLEK